MQGKLPLSELEAIKQGYKSRIPGGGVSLPPSKMHKRQTIRTKQQGVEGELGERGGWLST